MWDFFEAMKDFFESDFAKDNIMVIIALIVFFVILAVIATIFIFNKFIIPYKLGEARDINEKYQKILKENEKMSEDLKKYKNIKGMLEAINSEELGMPEDKALESFMKKEK